MLVTEKRLVVVLQKNSGTKLSIVTTHTHIHICTHIVSTDINGRMYACMYV